MSVRHVVEVHCDSCNAYWSSITTSTRIARANARALGWAIGWLVNRRRADFCPRCAESGKGTR